VASLNDIWDWDSPLERYKGETHRANTGLQDFFGMGPGRSLRILVRGYRGEIEPQEPLYVLFSQYRAQDGHGPGMLPPTKRLATVGGWSRDYQWQARIARHGQIELEHREEVRDLRRQEIEDLDWKTGSDLREKAARFMEALPKFIMNTVQEEAQEDGSVVKTVTLRMNTTLSQLSQAVKTASELQRLSTNEPTEITEIRGAALLMQLAAELDSLASATTTVDPEYDDDSGPEGTACGDPESTTDGVGPTAEGEPGDPAV